MNASPKRALTARGDPTRAPKPSKIRILIADDHPILRKGLRHLLEAQPDFEVVDEAHNGVQTLDFVMRYRPDLLILDMTLPELSGLEVLQKMAVGNMRTLLLTGEIEKDDLWQALDHGARGLVMKASDSEVLIRAIRAVMRGELWLERST